MSDRLMTFLCIIYIHSMKFNDNGPYNQAAHATMQPIRLYYNMMIYYRRYIDESMLVCYVMNE